MDIGIHIQLYMALGIILIIMVMSDYNFTAPCDLILDSYCSFPGPNYPWKSIKSFIKGNLGVTRRLFGDSNKEFVLETYRRESYGYNPCPSIMEAAQPYWARNMEGKLRAIVNHEPFTQFVQVERCYEAFIGLPNKCDSECGCYQDYRFQRLLVSDPHAENDGIFMDYFQFPFCCMCKCSKIFYANISDIEEETTTPKTANITTPNSTDFIETTPQQNDTFYNYSNYDYEISNITNFDANFTGILDIIKRGENSTYIKKHYNTSESKRKKGNKVKFARPTNISTF